MSPLDVITFFFWILSEILNKICRKNLQRFRIFATLKFLFKAKSMLPAYVGDKICGWRIRDVGDDIGHFCHQNLLFFYVSDWPNVSLRSLTKMMFSPGSTKVRTDGIRTVRPVRQFLIAFSLPFRVFGPNNQIANICCSVFVGSWLSMKPMKNFCRQKNRQQNPSS